MEDHNNRKRYDDFFPNDDSASSRDQDADRPENADRPAAEERPSYYYSYGPMSDGGGTRPVPAQPSGTSSPEPIEHRSEPLSSVHQPDSYGSQPEEPQPAPQQQKAARPYSVTTVNGGTSGWKVNETKRTSFKSVFLSFMAGVLVVGGLMYTADVQNWFTPGQAVTTQESGGQGDGPSAASGSGGGSAPVLASGERPDFSSLFAQASPAVVKIETFVKSQRRTGSSLLDDPFFRQFFGDDYPGLQAPQQEGDGQMQQTGIGTGFFFEADGHILTNQHVIGEADEIRVTVQGYDEPFKAELLGSSYDLDLAVIKITDDKAFPTLKLGSSDDINIGDWVVAIGNPYGFDHTITVGVLSAKERPIDIQDPNGERNYKHLLQTDASINPGNSGGPLLNAAGEVIGINTAVSSQAQGIGFAIPTSTIQEVLQNLKDNKEIPKEPVPFIGAELSNVNEEMAKQLGLDKAEGVIVRSVYYNSPAYLGDLKQFDVIVGVDGKKTLTTETLIAEIQSKEVGQKIQMNIIRQGKEMTLEIEVGDKNVFGIE